MEVNEMFNHSLHFKGRQYNSCVTVKMQCHINNPITECTAILLLTLLMLTYWNTGRFGTLTSSDIQLLR